MLPLIGGLITEAATSAIRGLGASRAVVAVTPADTSAIPLRRGDAVLVVADVALIRIEINLNFSR
jgi:uncharacterized protein YjlB